MGQPLLEVADLRTYFESEHGALRAVDGVSFTIERGSVLGIVGESGSGKSVTALSLMRLIVPPGRIVSGRALLHEDAMQRDLLALAPAELDHVRGNLLAMIFQDPMTSLNPVLSIGYQLIEPLRIHRGMSAADARAEAVRLLDRVGIPDPARRLADYPHQFSGGMRQRVMIAMAIACRPRLLIADEPTTALDVTIQAQILELLDELRQELGTAVLIITHDLGVIAQLADQVAVMYAGTIVEHGPVMQIFGAPQHPYTRALVAAIPRLHVWPERLMTIEGQPPTMTVAVSGCPFAPRCPERIERCELERPPLLALLPAQRCACWVAQERMAQHV